MAAGANASVNNATTIGKGTQDISVNGADPGNNNYQMDGVSIVNTANTGSAKDCGIYTGIGIPNPDAIQEFKIQTSTYDASYGGHPGGNVNVVTRSGSNQFHGSAWEFFRNTDLNANSFFRQSRRRRRQAGPESKPGGRLDRRPNQEGQAFLLRRLSGNSPEERSFNRRLQQRIFVPAARAIAPRLTSERPCARESSR